MGEYIFLCYKGQYKSVLKRSYSPLLYGVVTCHLYLYPCRRHSDKRLAAFASIRKPCFPSLAVFHPSIDYAVAETPRKRVVARRAFLNVNPRSSSLRAVSLHFLDYLGWSKQSKLPANSLSYPQAVSTLMFSKNGTKSTWPRM
jgi:hypothetical protein